MRPIFLSLLFFLIFSFSLIAHAQVGIVTCQEDCGWSQLLTEVNTFIRFLVYISAAVAAISFSYAGFLYLTAGGNPSQVEKAKGVFIKVLIGFIFVLAGWLIVETVLKLLGVNTGTFSLLGS